MNDAALITSIRINEKTIYAKTIFSAGQRLNTRLRSSLSYKTGLVPGPFLTIGVRTADGGTRPLSCRVTKERHCSSYLCRLSWRGSTTLLLRI
jgi:hypothetical protein